MFSVEIMAESSTSTPVIQTPSISKANVADLEKLKSLLASAGANSNITSSILLQNQQLLQGVAAAQAAAQQQVALCQLLPFKIQIFGMLHVIL